MTPKNPLERERQLEIVIQRHKQQRWRQHQQTAGQREHHSMNVEFLKYFTIKWKRFWIISLNISANIAVTKHALLADEFIPYRPRLLGFHSLHVHEVHLRWGFTVETAVILLKNMFEFSLIRLEGFNNKISTNLLVCSTWPSGKALPGASKV